MPVHKISKGMNAAAGMYLIKAIKGANMDSIDFIDPISIPRGMAIADDITKPAKTR